MPLRVIMLDEKDDGRTAEKSMAAAAVVVNRLDDGLVLTPLRIVVLLIIKIVTALAFLEKRLQYVVW